MRCLLLLVFCMLAAPAMAQQAALVTVTNPIGEARPDEVLELSWSDLARVLPDLRPEAVRAVGLDGAELVSQVLDLDGDGTPERLLVLVNLWPGETRTFRVEAAPAAETYAPRVHARHDAYRDDLAWESDRMAWRTYGKGLWQAQEFAPLVSSGIDVWLKRTRSLVTEAWYAKGHDAYHVDSGEGADFYSVGETLGAGGTALWHNDQLVRSENFDRWRILANGPIRAVFELAYDSLLVDGQEVTETKRFSIDAGQHFYRQENTYTANAGVIGAVGLVDREGVVESVREVGEWTWLSLWGPVERLNGGHGDLGTAVLVPSNRLLDIERPDRHLVATLRAAGTMPFVSYVGAGWTASGDVAGVQDWWALLDRLARRLAAPVQISIAP